MRRSDREVTDKKELMNILDQCMVLRIAMQDADGLYIVPLNFGYSYHKDTLKLYIHSAKEGRKVSALLNDGNVAFELDCDHKLVEADIACGYSYEYQSIIGKGYASIIEDAKEKRLALSQLMRHQTGKDFEFTDERAASVAVFQITVNSFTGKRRKQK